MYSYVDSISLSRSTGSQWTHTDISSFSVFDLYNNFSKIYLILSNPVLPTDVYVDFDILKQEFSGYSGTLEQLLVLLDNRTLDTVSSIPTTDVKIAKYSDAFRSEYKVNTTVIGMVLPDNYPEPDKHDLVITRPKYKTDMRLIHDYCLVSVNGFFHNTDADAKNAYVYGGAETMRKGRNNQMGILSFLDIGKLTKVRINKDDIRPQNNTSNLKDKIYFNIDPKYDLTDKSVILVLGGYLVFPEKDVFWQQGDSSFALNLQSLPYEQRLYESNRNIDLDGLDGLEIETPTNDPDILDFSKVWSDDSIKNYMTLSQSFLVIVDVKHLILNRIHLRYSNSPGMFTSYTDPVYPLIVNYGKAVEYWKTREDGFWSVTVQDSFYKDYIISQQHMTTSVINNFMVPNTPKIHSRGFLLEILGYHT